MRITLDLPEDLISEAMKVTGNKTRRAVIIQALKELVRKNKIAAIRNYEGKVDIGIDLNEIRAR